MRKRTFFPAAMILAAVILLAGCSAKKPLSGSETTAGQNSGSGNETDKEQPSDTGSRISREEAARIVLSRVEGAEESDIHELEADHDDGRFVYEGELLFNGYEYEFEIDGVTGEMIRWEIDRD